MTHKSWQGVSTTHFNFRLLSRLNELDLCGLFFTKWQFDLNYYSVSKIVHTNCFRRESNLNNVRVDLKNSFFVNNLSLTIELLLVQSRGGKINFYVNPIFMSTLLLRIQIWRYHYNKNGYCHTFGKYLVIFTKLWISLVNLVSFGQLW